MHNETSLEKPNFERSFPLYYTTILPLNFRCSPKEFYLFFYSGAPANFIKKVEAGPKLKVQVTKTGDGFNWQVDLGGDMKVTTAMKVGEAHSVGAHAPNYQVECFEVEWKHRSGQTSQP